MADASPTHSTDRTDGSGGNDTTAADFPDIAGMRYEDAREELIGIVAKLEAGQAPLEDSMRLWRRGEALAAHCARWLDGAQAEVERVTRGEHQPAGAQARPGAPLHADDEIFDEG